jgi:hypothetical protein
MILEGYDIETGRITDSNGAIVLASVTGTVAASWSFTGILAHWARKHMRAVYVPSILRREPAWQYSYGPLVRLAQNTDSLMLLEALASGMVYYDPGIKLEQASTSPTIKRRSQFRVASRNIGALYRELEVVEV